MRFLLCLATVLGWIGAANAQSDQVKRGDYLVNTIMTCGLATHRKGRPPRLLARIFPAACRGMSRHSR